MSCVELNKDFAAADCSNKAGGTAKRVILINLADIASVTTSAGVVSALTLASGKTGFSFTSRDDSTTASFTANRGDYLVTYSHEVVLRDMVGGSEAYEFMDALKNSRVVAIVENFGKGDAGKTKYTIYGLQNGLVLTGDTGTTDIENGVVSEVTLSSSDKSQEPSRPINFYITDEATTDTAIEGLL